MPYITLIFSPLPLFRLPVQALHSSGRFLLPPSLAREVAALKIAVTNNIDAFNQKLKQYNDILYSHNSDSDDEEEEESVSEGHNSERSSRINGSGNNSEVDSKERAYGMRLRGGMIKAMVAIDRVLTPNAGERGQNYDRKGDEGSEEEEEEEEEDDQGDENGDEGMYDDGGDNNNDDNNNDDAGSGNNGECNADGAGGGGYGGNSDDSNDYDTGNGDNNNAGNDHDDGGSGDNNPSSPTSDTPPAWLRLPPLTDGEYPLYNTAFDLSDVIRINSDQLPSAYDITDTIINKYTIMCDVTESIIYKIFRVQRRAAEFIGRKQSNGISLCCTGTATEAFGFRWKCVRGTYAECKYTASYCIILAVTHSILLIQH